MSKKDDDTGAGFGAPWLNRLMHGFNKESAQQVWLAGLGALARAQAEGTKAFETLAKEGATWQKKTSAAAEEKFGDMQAKAGQRWDQMEGLVEEQTTKVLKRLGVPTAQDLEALNARIDALNAKVATLTRSATAKAKAKAKTAAHPAVPKKTAVKKAAARRSKV